MEIKQIMSLIPHRYPFLLIDRVLELKEGERAIALKNVTINESFFCGHFPNDPVMPGVLLIEAMAQAAAICVASTLSANVANKIIYFMSIENAHFRKPVLPGDSLYLYVEKIYSRSNAWKIKGEAKVEGIRVADSVFSAILLDRENK